MLESFYRKVQPLKEWCFPAQSGPTGNRYVFFWIAWGLKNRLQNLSILVDQWTNRGLPEANWDYISGGSAPFRMVDGHQLFVSMEQQIVSGGFSISCNVSHLEWESPTQDVHPKNVGTSHKETKRHIPSCLQMTVMICHDTMKTSQAHPGSCSPGPVCPVWQAKVTRSSGTAGRLFPGFSDRGCCETCQM